MTEKQKRDYIISLLTAAYLPPEIESELIRYVKAKCPDDVLVNNFMAGAEFMRRAAINSIMKLEKDCLGIQKAGFVVSRNAIEQIDFVGIGL